MGLALTIFRLPVRACILAIQSVAWLSDIPDVINLNHIHLISHLSHYKESWNDQIILHNSVI